MNDIYFVKKGDKIVRNVTNAKRIVHDVLVINRSVYVVSQYDSSNDPRLDSLKHLQEWGWSIIDSEDAS